MNRQLECNIFFEQFSNFVVTLDTSLIMIGSSAFRYPSKPGRQTVHLSGQSLILSVTPVFYQPILMVLNNGNGNGNSII